MYKGDWDNGRYADYIGSCHALDQNVGRLVDTLIVDQNLARKVYQADPAQGESER